MEYADEASSTVAKDALHNFKIDGETKMKVGPGTRSFCLVRVLAVLMNRSSDLCAGYVREKVDADLVLGPWEEITHHHIVCLSRLAIISYVFLQVFWHSVWPFGGRWLRDNTYTAEARSFL